VKGCEKEIFCLGIVLFGKVSICEGSGIDNPVLEFIFIKRELPLHAYSTEVHALLNISELGVDLSQDKQSGCILCL